MTVFDDEEDIALLVEDDSRPVLEPDQTSAPDETIVRITCALPELTWRELRQLLKLAYKTLGAGRKTDSQSATASRDMGERSGNSSATESRVTEPPDLLTWGKTYLPEHFLKPPSAMQQWMAEKLDGMAESRGMKRGLGSRLPVG